MNIISNLIEAHIFREMNGQIEFLLLKRSPTQYYPNLWQMISGKIKPNEKAFECALREIKEETGLTPLNLWVVPNVNSFYTAENDSITSVPVFATKVNYNSEINLSNEHVEYKWLSSEEAKQHLAWVGQKKSVDVIVDYFFNKNIFLNLLEINM
ncbi:MAG: NUDIX domain-containing protein [Ignavibacteriaceae bacterium]|nr:NUDIX domain-containing protein [Ignavibacteriaceae bacterium]